MRAIDALQSRTHNECLAARRRTEEGRRSMENPDALPLPVEAVKVFVANFRVVQAASDPWFVVDLVVGVSLALNFLYGVGWAKNSVSPVLFFAAVRFPTNVGC